MCLNRVNQRMLYIPKCVTFLLLGSNVDIDINFAPLYSTGRSCFHGV